MFSNENSLFKYLTSWVSATHLISFLTSTKLWLIAWLEASLMSWYLALLYWWIWVRNFWPKSGRVSHLWFGFGKFPLKILNFSITCPLGKKNIIGSGQKVPGSGSYLLPVKIMLGSGRVGSEPISNCFTINWNPHLDLNPVTLNTHLFKLTTFCTNTDWQMKILTSKRRYPKQAFIQEIIWGRLTQAGVEPRPAVWKSRAFIAY